MKIISSISSLMIKHSVLIIIGYLAYFIALFVLDFAFSVPMLLLGIVSPIVLIYFINRPKVFIYSIVCYWPFSFLINKFFSFLPGGSSYLSVNVLGVVFVSGVIIGIVVLLEKRAHIFENQLTIPMLIFIGSIMLGVFLSPLKFWAFRWMFRYGMPATLYLLILETCDFKDAKKLLKVILIAYIPVILFSYFMFFQQRESLAQYDALSSGEAIYRLGGAGFHPNTLALQMSIYIILAMFFYLESQRKYKWIFLFLIINMIFLLFNTYSRMGWVCIVAGISVITLLRNRKLFLVFLLIGSFVFTISPFVTHRVTERFDERGAVESRFKKYEFAWELFLRSPVFGNGQGAFQLATTSSQWGVRKSQEYGVGGSLAHNEYLRILSELGIVGMSAFLFLMFSFLRLSIQIFKLPHPITKNYGAFFMAVMAISLVAGIPGHGFMYTNFFIWNFAAIGEIYLRELQYPKSADN